MVREIGVSTSGDSNDIKIYYNKFIAGFLLVVMVFINIPLFKILNIGYWDRFVFISALAISFSFMLYIIFIVFRVFFRKEPALTVSDSYIEYHIIWKNKAVRVKISDIRDINISRINNNTTIVIFLKKNNFDNKKIGVFSIFGDINIGTALLSKCNEYILVEKIKERMGNING